MRECDKCQGILNKINKIQGVKNYPSACFSFVVGGGRDQEGKLLGQIKVGITVMEMDELIMNTRQRE